MFRVVKKYSYEMNTMVREKLKKGNYRTLDRSNKQSLIQRLLQKKKYKREYYSNTPLELEIQKSLIPNLSNNEDFSDKEISAHQKEKSTHYQNKELRKYLSRDKIFLSSGDLSKISWISSQYKPFTSKSLNSGLNICTTNELLLSYTKNVKQNTSLQDILTLSDIRSESTEERKDYDNCLCHMCLSILSLNEMYLLKDCGCKFCSMCMQQYLTINILEGNISINCPNPFCKIEGNIQESEVKKLVDNEIFNKYRRFKYNAEIEQDPDRFWCPNPGCDAVCQFESSDINVPVVCPNCNLMFCSLCKEYWHSTVTCDDLKKKYKKLVKKSSAPFTIMEENIIKQCPGCNIPIERNEGCAQMKCRCCKHIFCWHCLALLDDDVLLRHFDKGPCKNKLGHSRASLMWHRIRVIITIVGLSALLATLSPLLLISLPFLLCCKCNLCKKLQR